MEISFLISGENMTELRVRDVMGHLTGPVVIINGEERVVVPRPSGMLWTCPPSQYGTGSVRVVPHALTTKKFLI
jgi:hypothetical protein